jgi:hypothetical protein
MNVKSRLHIYQPKETKGRGYIIGERSAMLALADALKRAATGVIGTETINLYTSDGHDYEIMITKSVEEEEWQNFPKDPSGLESIKIYNEVKQSLNKP